MERTKQKEKQINLIRFHIDDRINGGLTNGKRKTIHDFVKGKEEEEKINSNLQ